MDPHYVEGTPSDVRRRLSGVLTAVGEESAKDVANRRRSSVVKLDDVAEIIERKHGGSTEGSRRTSILTNFFAKSTTSFDYQEKSIRPTLIIAMIYFRNPRPDVQKLRAVVADRLLEIPRFCSTFREQDGAVFFDQVARGEVDLEHHVQFKNGSGKFGEKETGQLITSSCLEWWDAKRPLWQMTLVTNMDDGRSMLFCKIDHALGDGVALASVLLSLLDDPPKEMKSFQRRREEMPTVALSQRIVDCVRGIFYGTIGWALTGFDPDNGLKVGREKKLKDFGHKTFTQVNPISLDKVKAMKEKLNGTTVNDVILAILTIAMRKYFEKTNDPVLELVDKGKDLHMNFVVNTRSQASYEQSVSLGNDFQVASLPFPLRYSSPIDAVWRSKALVDYLKLSPALFLLKLVVTKIIAVLPEEALIAAAVDNSFKPTGFVTNVMGPSFEATMAGNSVDSLSYLASANIGLYFGVLSYNGRINISFTTDSLAQIDCSLLKSCVEEAYDGLGKDIMEASPAELKNPNLKSWAARALEVAAPFTAAVALSYLYRAWMK